MRGLRKHDPRNRPAWRPRRAYRYDGGIAGEKVLKPYPQLAEERSEDGLLSIEGIAEMYCQIHRQQRSAWAQEIDLRLYKGGF